MTLVHYDFPCIQFTHAAIDVLTLAPLELGSMVRSEATDQWLHPSTRLSFDASA